MFSLSLYMCEGLEAVLFFCLFDWLIDWLIECMKEWMNGLEDFPLLSERVATRNVLWVTLTRARARAKAEAKAKVKARPVRIDGSRWLDWNFVWAKPQKSIFCPSGNRAPPPHRSPSSAFARPPGRQTDRGNKRRAPKTTRTEGPKDNPPDVLSSKEQRKTTRSWNRTCALWPALALPCLALPCKGHFLVSDRGWAGDACCQKRHGL